MKITTQKVKDLPVAVIDDYYTDEELASIWKELDYYDVDNLFLDPKDSGSAFDHSGNFLKQNKTITLDWQYSNRNFSNILIANRKLFGETGFNLEKEHIMFYHLRRCNVDRTLLSYYEDSDYYKQHNDSGIFTCVTWLYREPKSFTGGEMIICDDLKVDCLNNRTIIFPSILPHEVTSIHMTEDKKGWGRYAIVQLTSESLDGYLNQGEINL